MHSGLNYFLLLLSTLFLCIVSSTSCFGTPLIKNLNGQSFNGGTMTIIGANFGLKPTAAPKYYSNLENETVGKIPRGWVKASTGVEVSNSRSSDGVSALKATFDGKDDWSQIKIDLGEMKNLYFTANIYFEKDDTCSGQFKAWRITSSPSAYNVFEEAGTTSFINDFWFFRNPDRWGNNSSFVYYNGGKSIGATIGTQSDLILFNKWQRIEQFVKGSSSASVADGYMWTRRVGRLGDLQHASNFVTFAKNNTRWRYFMLGQAWGQHSDCSSGNAAVFYDNIYIDNTLARVEIGNAPNWKDCTHREIQIPISWNNSEIKIKINKGAMSSFVNKYLFVVDHEGNVSKGFLLTKFETPSLITIYPKSDNSQ